MGDVARYWAANLKQAAQATSFLAPTTIVGTVGVTAVVEILSAILNVEPWPPLVQLLAVMIATYLLFAVPMFTYNVLRVPAAAHREQRAALAEYKRDLVRLAITGVSNGRCELRVLATNPGQPTSLADWVIGIGISGDLRECKPSHVSVIGDQSGRLHIEPIPAGGRREYSLIVSGAAPPQSGAVVLVRCKDARGAAVTTKDVAP